MNELDSYSFPLYGASLIEASAGTGKTYTIVNLYLRILLGHQPSRHQSSNATQTQPLSVDKILVVTFTNAATAELRERIRDRIQTAYLDFYRGSSDDAFIQQLIDDTDKLEWACETLSLAAKQMDEASIYTIHSFCQKMLSEHAFESGSVFDETLELDQSAWFKQATQDHWRRFVVTLSADMLIQVTSLWASPQALEKQLSNLINRNVTPLKVTDWTQANKDLERLKESTQRLKKWWLNGNIAEQLQQAKLKKNTKLGKPPLYQKMAQFCQSDDSICPFDNGWADFFPEKVEKARAKTSADLSHLDFSLFEDLQSQTVRLQNSVQSALLNDALLNVRKNLDDFKRQTRQLSPDDLLSRLNAALISPNSKLAQLIRHQYPVAMIDEFQDTDEIQFDVFSTIYPLTIGDCENSAGISHCMVMIGDPKQAIYGFRGADIYTYIHAKRLIEPQRHFTLAKNWRTQASLVQCVNHIFQNSEQGFLLNDDIPFHGVAPARPDATIELAARPQSSLDFCIAKGEQDILSNNDAKAILAVRASNVIVDMLQDGVVVTANKDAADKACDTVPITSGDVCILVRDRTEAQLMKQTLAQANIDSVFLARQSVFGSNTAVDLYRILLALSNPTDDVQVRAAILSSVLCFDGQQLDTLFNDELAWQQLVEQFVLWRTSWQKHGVMTALNQVMQHFDVFSSLLLDKTDGLRKLTDLRHLIEILQHQANETPGESQLCYWFWQHISDPDHNNEGQQLRLETDSELVQIVTMHASKGLEFPVVFIPFACAYRETDSAIYHSEDNTLYVDFEYASDSQERADYERLAEDIRLFYVAITRAIYYCFVGCWNPPVAKRKNQSALKRCALGALLLRNDDEPSTESLNDRLQQMANTCSGITVSISTDEDGVSEYVNTQKPLNQRFSYQTLDTQIDRSWRITSYSAIARNQFEVEHGQRQNDELPVIDKRTPDESSDLTNPKSLLLNRFSFVRGAQAGSFLHGVLENIDFQSSDQLVPMIEQQGSWYGIDDLWFDTINTWLCDVLTTPIALPPTEQASLTEFRLHELGQSSICPEMEFHLPLTHVSESEFNNIINTTFKTIKRRYDFQQLHGMLKGYIDLTFCVNGQFFVADYKSNHLGDSFESYDQQAMEMAMQDHDYHLQSLLYVLALHRFLSIRLKDYDYDKHVGGAYYWFLRGMSASSQCNSGVYFFKPHKSVILKLDELFSGKDTMASQIEEGTAEQLALW